MAVTMFLIYVIIALAPILLYLIKRRLNYWKDMGIPQEKPSLLMGNMQGFRHARSIRDIYTGIYEKFKGTGPFCGFYFYQRPSVVLLNLEMIKNVLIKDFWNFADRGIFYNEKDDPLTGHLFRIDGVKWRKLRTKLSPTFSSGKMKFMYPTIIDVVHTFVKVLDEIVGTTETVEIRELLARFTTDVIGTCAFGIECNSLKDPEAEFRVMGRRFFSSRRHNAIVEGFIDTFPKLARKLHMRILTDETTNFFTRIVRETVEYRVKNNIQRNDFLNILMELGNDKNADGDSNGLTIEEMAAQSFVFFLGGFETSSTTIGYALYELALSQQIQDRLRGEILEIWKKHNNEFTYESTKEMTYMGQVISETLRKYPIVPHLTREAKNDYPVPGYPKYVIPKGTTVTIPVNGVHHDPEIYPNPQQFDPERFAAEQAQQRDPVAFLGFGDGPRNCIGLRFGQMQTRIGLAFLIKHFRFSPCDNTEVPLVFDRTQFFTTPKNGIYLKVESI